MGYLSFNNSVFLHRDSKVFNGMTRDERYIALCLPSFLGGDETAVLKVGGRPATVKDIAKEAKMDEGVIRLAMNTMKMASVVVEEGGIYYANPYIMRSKHLDYCPKLDKMFPRELVYGYDYDDSYDFP